jgi:hypothetical protein
LSSFIAHPKGLHGASSPPIFLGFPFDRWRCRVLALDQCRERLTAPSLLAQDQQQQPQALANADHAIIA